MEEVALVVDEGNIFLLREYFNVCSSVHTSAEDVMLISFSASYNRNWMRNKFWSWGYAYFL
jgi:hypothetical protein